MNELKQMPKDLLLSKTENLVKEERRITSEVLECLHAIESRMIFAELAYSSMYEFCVKHLKYSEGAAHRRISAMRLLKNLPESTRKETQEKIKSGTLSITNLSLMHGFLKVESREKKNYSEEEKVSFLHKMENQSKREVEKQFASIQLKIIKKESEKVITESLTEIRFIADEALMEKLKRIKEISSHKNIQAKKESSWINVLHQLADEYLERNDPIQKAERIIAKNTSLNSTSPESSSTKGNSISNQPGLKIEVRRIPTAIRREIWLRDQGKCTFEKEGRKCGSKFGIEVDHIQPYGMGGTHAPNNLRLLCREHNQLQSKKAYG